MALKISVGILTVMCIAGTCSSFLKTASDPESPIPCVQQDKNGVESTIMCAAGCCGSPSNRQCCIDPRPAETLYVIWKIEMVVVLVACNIGAIIIVAWCVYRCVCARRRAEKNEDHFLPSIQK